MKHPGQEQSFDLHIGGLGRFDGSQDRPHHAGWPSPDVTTGDELTIRVLPGGEYDDPAGIGRAPGESVSDAEFGELHQYANAWHAEIDFRTGPFELADLRFHADQSGPTPKQRLLVNELHTRRVELWPMLSEALVRCHREVSCTEELAERLSPRLSIELDKDSEEISLCYKTEGDAERRSYHITLRDWVICEICTAR